MKMAAPDLLDPKAAAQNSKPRLSFSAKPTVLSTREERDITVNVMKWKTVSTVFLVVVLYLIIGATVFKALEQPYETSQRTTILIQKSNFVSDHSCVNATELDELIQHVMAAINAGIIPLGNASSQNSHWDLGSSFFFAGTVITTIGFGNISPRTKGGKIFCIIYALLGIPLFGFLLAGVGDQLGTIFGKGIARVEDIFVKWNVSQTKIRIISTFIFILFGCVLFVAIPAIIFQHIENWHTLDAFYFVVITLTTIGFGDYVAGGSDIEYLDFYKPVVWFWILVGLAYFAAVLSMIGDWLRVLSKKTKEEKSCLPVLCAPAVIPGSTVSYISLRTTLAAKELGSKGKTGEEKQSRRGACLESLLRTTTDRCSKSSVNRTQGWRIQGARSRVDSKRHSRIQRDPEASKRRDLRQVPTGYLH
ncbi:hypothetical protein GDO81_008812 [Engystomops pustulosus]|uniref:Potassium channel domain-containing protein n=1 Tax=Engystomops pustulosus TaxID=76066 RepID=A0AAV7CIY5_ENGPU|nr:hypothetical protein GDO81_008812 [Engystomops pustulosus]